MDGTLKMESAYKNGLRDGKQIFYYPNGKVYYNGAYTADEKSGIWEYYTVEGVSDTIINYNE
jgi:antitoxin component YwqK of YwqJK toxin-antitoxin module